MDEKRSNRADHEETIATATTFSYFGTEGTDLHALSEAENYYRWITSHFAPHLGKRVVEVGAGIGNFSQFLLNATTTSEFTLVELAGNLFPLLQQRFSGESRVTLVNGRFEDLATSLCADCVVLVNVLEHIEDDHALLHAIHHSLVQGGTLLLFVPALTWLYGTLDEVAGHFRRYSKPALAETLRASGFEIVHLRYFNLLGMVPWLLAGKVLKRRTIRPRDVRLYDRWVIPYIAKLEDSWEPPLGQSLIAIARK